MGKLLAQMRTAPKGITGSIPQLQKILDAMNPGDRADLLAALDDPNIKTPSLVRVLAARGITISGSSVYRYRSGDLAHTVR